MSAANTNPRTHRPGCWLPADHRGACRRKTNGAHDMGLRSILEEYHPELGDPYAAARAEREASHTKRPADD